MSENKTTIPASYIIGRGKFGSNWNRYYLHPNSIFISVGFCYTELAMEVSENPSITYRSNEFGRFHSRFA